MAYLRSQEGEGLFFAVDEETYQDIRRRVSAHGESVPALSWY